MRSTDLTLRKDLDRPIEWDEMDTNLENLDSDSPWIVHNGHISYSGKVSLYGTDAEYDLDFMDGVNNIATLGTQDAELQVHIDGANSFKVITNTQERITLTTDGLTGIGITEPEHPLDVDGVIQTTTTFLGNQAYCNSFYDGTLTISGGSITNSQTIVNMGVIQWTSLYDRQTGITVREFEQDRLSGDFDKVPTSAAIRYELDSNNAKMESTGLHEVTDIGNSTTNDIKVKNITTDGFIDSAGLTSLVLRPDGDLFGTVTGGWKVPVGTTGERPSDTTGYMRFNTSTSAFEGYNGSAWASLGGVMDVDQDTYILPELSPTSDEDALFFYTAGSEKMRISESGDVLIGRTSSTNSATTYGTHVYGNGIIYQFAEAAASDDIHRWHNGTGTRVATLNGSGGLIINGNITASNHIIPVNSAGTFGIPNSSRMEAWDDASQTKLAFYAGTTLVATFDTDGSALFTGRVNADGVSIGGTTVRRDNISGVHFGVDSIRPVGTSNTTEDAVIDLGATGFRFKDAHFSGTVNTNWVNATGQWVGSQGRTALAFSSTSIYPGVWTSANPANSNGTIDLGTDAIKFKDARLSGTVYAGSGSFSTSITAPTFVGKLTGTLTTPRNINGTAFDGGSNITTVQWGTPRNLTIGDTTKSVNGSTNYVWTKAEIGITKANIDALGLSVNNADKLTTPRNINGTAFDGTANITTAQWGTGRSISIGGTAKTVNGSANYSWAPSEITAGKVSNSFTVQGTAFDGSAAKSVTFTGGTGISISGTTITNDLGGVPVSISGGGITTVSGTYPNFTISTPNTNVNTTYTAGSGMTLTGTQFINAAPDRTVSITGTGATTVTGTYPNFTVSSTDTNTNTTYTAGNGLTLSGTQFLMSGSYSGTFTATGDVVAFSDIALKEDINPITAALDKVSQLTGYTFRRKGEERVSTGVMAQEVQAVLPEAVHDNEGTLGVAYGNMVGLLIEAVKELSGKVETLESELNKTK